MEPKYFGSGNTANWDSANRVLEINELVADVVFGPENSGEPVHLDLDEDVLEQLASRRGETAQQFLSHVIDAVRSISNVGGAKAALSEFAEATRRWRNLMKTRPGAGLNVPPALALLVCLAYAAEQMRRTDDEGEQGGLIAAGNYYSRLGEVFGDRDWGSTEWQNEYRVSAEVLWGSLSEWLEAWEDERGKCTVIFPGASRSGNWAIQMPISQALLREADRENLHELFRVRGLDPGLPISDEMMTLLIGEWCPSYGTNHLRKLWKSPDYRESVVSSAQRTLLNWAGPPDARESAGSASVTARVGLTIDVNTFTRRLDVGIEIRAATHDLPSSVDIRLEDGTSHKAELQAAGPRAARIIDRGTFDTESLFAGVIRVSHAQANMQGIRRPRGIVPFLASSFGRSYAEVTSLSLGARHGLLVKRQTDSGRNNFDNVEKVLTKAARPGWKVLDSSLFKGIPDGWVFIEDIELVTFPDPKETTGLLEVLKPNRIESLRFSDGFRIPGRRERWLAVAPPTVLAVFPFECEVVIQVGRIDGEVIWRSSPSRSVGLVDLAAANLDSGAYRITALSDGEPKLRSALYLVDADTLSSAALDDSRIRYHDLSRPFGLLTATSGSPIPETTLMVRGLGIDDARGLVDPATAGEEIPIPAARSWGQSGSDAAGAVHEPLRIARDANNSCVEDHYFLLPTAGKGPGPASVEGVCKRCSLVKKFPGRPVLRAELKKSTGKSSKPAAPADVPLPKEVVQMVPPIPSKGPGAWDRAFEALCYMRHGTAADLIQVAEQVAAGSVGVDRLVRGLSALGHIDVALNERCRPESWSVSPPVLVATGEGKGHLAGFRSSSILTALEARVDSLGGVVTKIQQEAAPVAFLISLPDGVSLEAAVEGIPDSATGQSITVQYNVASRLVKVLHPISAVITDCPQIRQPSYRQINKWAGSKATWEPASTGLAAGAYQNIGNGYAYTFNSQDLEPGDLTFCSTASAVKHAESLVRGVPLAFYVAETRIFCTRLGAELPGLVARAAVALSGRLPEEDEQDRLVKYHDVDSETAQYLYKLLRR